MKNKTLYLNGNTLVRPPKGKSLSPKDCDSWIEVRRNFDDTDVYAISCTKTKSGKVAIRSADVLSIINEIPLSALAWLCNNDTRGIEHYVDFSSITNSNDLVKTLMLDELLPGLSKYAIGKIAESISSNEVIALSDINKSPSIKERDDRPELVDAFAYSFLSGTLKRSVGKYRGIKLVDSNCPRILPLCYYSYGSRKNDRVFNKVYLTYKDGSTKSFDLDKPELLTKKHKTFFINTSIHIPEDVVQAVYWVSSCDPVTKTGINAVIYNYSN